MTDDIDKEINMKEKMQVGKNFPRFPKNTKDINGKVLNLDNFKNKIVLIDFWATWCMPCIKELPNVKNAYEKFKEKGFEIISISLDNDKNAYEKFIKKENMTWLHVFDGNGWESELSKFFYIKSIPATFLLKDNMIIAKDLRGDELNLKLEELFKK
jgi:peroxiredoxin